MQAKTIFGYRKKISSQEAVSIPEPKLRYRLCRPFRAEPLLVNFHRAHALGFSMSPLRGSFLKANTIPICEEFCPFIVFGRKVLTLPLHNGAIKDMRPLRGSVFITYTKPGLQALGFTTSPLREILRVFASSRENDLPSGSFYT